MTSDLSVSPELVTGLDVGGTKVHVLDTRSDTIHHYLTGGYPDLYAVLDDYFVKIQARPARIALAMAGPRDEATGKVKMTNSPWPLFDPAEAASRYPGTTFETYNDMNAMTAGIASAHSDSFKLLKQGKSVLKGNKVAVTISTGFGVGAAVYDRTSGGYTLLDSEIGHTGFQPYDDIQKKFLEFLYTKYSDPSWELALSGKYGIDNWLEFLYDKLHAPKLGGALERAAEAGRPCGAVLLEFAAAGDGEDKEAARVILNHMACLTATGLSTLALAYMAKGGIYLTGSVSLALAEYWAENTDFKKAFIRRGTDDHAVWLESFLDSTPIYLVTDPHIAVKGALVLAGQT
jgi:glucokinase